jgi:hypothetical protein
MPAPPPATRFVAAEAGFLPPGPFVDFADMIVFGSSSWYAMRSEDVVSSSLTRSSAIFGNYASQGVYNRKRHNVVRGMQA